MSEHVDEKEALVERRDNHIWITGDINQEMYHEFYKNLIDVHMYCRRLDYNHSPVVVHIHSDGGEAFAGFAIYDLLKGYSGEVTTIVEGKANSAGSIILMAGRHRYIRPSGFLLIHDVQGGFYGRSKDVKDFAKVMRQIRDRMHSIYRVASGRTSDQIDELLDKESWLGAEEAVALNFAELLTTTIL